MTQNSSNLETENQPISPTKNERDIRFANMKLMRQKILDIRERRQMMPEFKQPEIVIAFADLFGSKRRLIKKKSLENSIIVKKKEHKRLAGQLRQYQLEYTEKEKSLKETEQLLKILTDKLESEYQKTKHSFKEVSFNHSMSVSVRKVNLYRLGELVFNNNARNVFQAISNFTGAQDIEQSGVSSPSKGDEEVGICLGYLGLLITLVGEVYGARLWINFKFRGSKSTIKLSDGSTLVLRPTENRYSEGTNCLIQQLHQIMFYHMKINQPKSKNLYEMCEQLSHILLGP